MKRLNLGILAHVDAGKTSLTERLLYATGVLDTVGSVDAGTTQTDFLALERRRGITIRSAVAAFTVGDVGVNLIDTPGHPDFIAEVERALSVLDGAVLVVSAVEGVQAQTVVLMRALRRLRVPTMIFVNKIDRAGADPDRVVRTIRARLTRQAIPMGSTNNDGRRDADFAGYDHDDPAFLDSLAEALVDHDQTLLAALVTRRDEISSAELHAHLARQSAAAQVHPIFFGSAITGAGVAALVASLPTYLPAADGDSDGPAAASVFKVERGPRGEKSAYLRMFAGTLRLRDRIYLGPGRSATVTALQVFEPGSLTTANAVSAGQIAKVSGLRDARVGDTIGSSPRPDTGAVFALPTLETAVVARNPAHQSALHTALVQLAEQDPLIRLRQDDTRQELFVSLYGDVQKEVIADTLAVEYGIDVAFRETAAICVERVAGTGGAVEHLHDPAPFLATVGLTVAPGPAGSGITFRLAVDLVTIPLYVYKTVDAFSDAMAEYVSDTLQQGLSGWQVTDAVVTMTDSGYTSPSTTAADFRKLTPLVLMAAVQQAGTVVCEPIDAFHLEAPAPTLSGVLRLLARHRAVPRAQEVDGQWCTVEGHLPAVEVQRLQQQISGHTSGEGVLEVHLDHYDPVAGAVPTRPRSDHNPLDRKEYLLHVLRHL